MMDVAVKICLKHEDRNDNTVVYIDYIDYVCVFFCC